MRRLLLLETHKGIFIVKLTRSVLLLALLHTPALGASLTVGPDVPPPSGFAELCKQDGAACSTSAATPSSIVLTPEKWTQLNEVNDYVNRNIPQIEDSENYGVAEKWTYPNERGGDCEDLALLKRRMLMERGWPADALLLTTVREWNGEKHAVLTVVTAGDEFVLDNKNWAILPVDVAPYVWIKRQSRLRPSEWVDLGHAEEAKE